MTSLDQVDILAAELKKLLPMKPEDKQKLDKKFRLEFNYNSNHIEGNTLTYSETELLLVFDDTKGNHTMREYEEMKAHDVAYHLVEEWAEDKERPLTEQNIKNLNEVILVRPFWKDAITPDRQKSRRLIKVGDYKEYPNSVELPNGEIFHYASPTDTPILMQELIDWYRSEENNLHPVTLAAMLHYKFVRIHPFDDGNGRVSRLLMNYVLLRNGLPPVVVKAKDKAGYIRALNRADVGDFGAFIDYIAEQTMWSLQISVKAAQGQSIEEADDIEKEISTWMKGLTSESIAGVQRSDDEVYNVWEHSISPLLHRFIEKHKLLLPLFVSMEVYSLVNNASGNGIEYIEGLMQQYFISQGGFMNAGEAPEPQHANFYEIKLNLSLRGYKKNGMDMFDCHATISFYFEQLKWRITYSNNKKIEKLYDQTLSEDEIVTIVRDAIKDAQTEIDRRVNKQ